MSAQRNRAARERERGGGGRTEEENIEGKISKGVKMERDGTETTEDRRPRTMSLAPLAEKAERLEGNGQRSDAKREMHAKKAGF